MKLSRLVLPLAVLSLAASCKQEPKAQVLARVGGSIITQEDFDSRLTDIAPEYKAHLATPQGRKDFLDILIKGKLINVAAHQSAVASSKEYKEKVASNKRRMEQRLREIDDEMLTRMWLEKQRESGTLAVAEQEVKAAYDQNPYEYAVSHILLKNREDADRVLKEIKTGRISFENAAKKYSLDPETAPRGGNTRLFMAGDLVPEIDAAAKTLKDGEVSGVLQTRIGFHLVKKNGQRKIPFEECKEVVRLTLEKKKLDGQLDVLKTKYKVEVVDESYK